MTYLILGFCIGIVLVALVLAPKLKQVKQLDAEIERQTAELKAQQEETRQQLLKIIEQCTDAKVDLATAQTEYDNLLHQQQLVKDSIKDLEEQAQNASDIFYQEKMKLAETNFANNLEKLANDYTELKADCENEYLQLLEQEAQRFQEQLTKNREELDKLNQALEDKKRAVQAAIEEAKRQQELEEQEEFYKIKLSDIDKEEIARLRTVVPYLRSAEPINKVIWSVYYMKPLNDLIGRIIGKETKCGIYKLTNTKNKKVYIGQAVSVSDRWKQHVKRGVGAETPTRNKLYPEMQEYGPELFTFELLEECPKDQLNAREKYWIEYFDSCTWGYNGNTGVGEK